MVHTETCNLWTGLRLGDLDYHFPMSPTEQLPFYLSYLKMKTNPPSETICYFCNTGEWMKSRTHVFLTYDWSFCNSGMKQVTWLWRQKSINQFLDWL